jgi:Zinc finger, ZZ type
MNSKLNNEIDNNQEIHIWHHCHHCGMSPIMGERYRCQSCPDGPDNDLCGVCYDLFQKGKITHPAEDSYAVGLTTRDHYFKRFSGKPAHLFNEWLTAKHPEVNNPFYPSRFIIRPIFNSHGESVIGGYGFVTTLDSNPQPLVLTALHVMDEMIKKKAIDCKGENDHFTGCELPDVITDVNLFDLFADNWMMAPLGNGGPMLVLPNARTGDEEPISYRDIAAFHVHPADTVNLNPVPLAKKKLLVGEPVWLAARSMNYPNERIFKAVVVESTDKTLIFKYLSREEKTKYTSGAPLLNANGEVVGINVGGGQLEDQRLGHANNVDSIRLHLKELR